MKNDKDFELKNNLPEVVNDPEICEEDFKLVDADERVHEQKFSTKPTTFLKDSMKRFSKNKSSVVAAGILGFLLLLSFIVPVVSTADVSTSHPELRYLEPKLFNAGTGFWDGTKKWSNIATDTSLMPDASTDEDKEKYWFPSPVDFKANGIIKGSKKFSAPTYTSKASEYGKDGYMQIGYYDTFTGDYISFSTFETDDFNVKVKDTDPSFELDVSDPENKPTWLTVFDVYDEAKLKTLEGNSYSIPENYEQGECALFFNFYKTVDGKQVLASVQLTEYASVHNIGSAIDSLKQEKINIAKIIAESPEVEGRTSFDVVSFSVRIKNLDNKAHTCVLLKSIGFESESTNTSTLRIFRNISMSDATQEMMQAYQTDSSKYNYKYWFCDGGNSSVRKLYMGKVIYCSFTYDSYEAMLGSFSLDTFAISKLEQYYRNKYIDYLAVSTLDPVTHKYKLDENSFRFTILNAKKCPIREALTKDNFKVNEDNGEIRCINVPITGYKYYGYSSMPKFLFGTDKTGRDMLKYVFEGLRFSLVLGILTFLVCFLFGLVYGAISGYFGGTVDLVMERFTDILSGVPWIVVMTLVVIHLGSNFWTFALALCLTGWIGTASTTRTQFYRFRGREYVLASRTLGANDARLIARHILPNAMGTIVTGAVLMIPSVIFSEATISYLGLGLRNLPSLGVILSRNQAELMNNPHLLLFPAMVIALLMISFNLFGNGLRDAINPSLKGEGE